jgi:hypothetical protein
MATFKCDNCGELNHESQKITNAGPTYINKIVLLMALFMPGSGGSRGMFTSGNVCKKCQWQVYILIGFIMIFLTGVILGFLNKFNII